MSDTKADAVRKLAETVVDPVFKRSLLEIAKGLDLAAKFKRIDMSFLQMRGANGIPKFALLPYDDFKAGDKSCVLDYQGYHFLDPKVSGGVVKRFGELFVRGDAFSNSMALPKVMVPESVDATVEAERQSFDEILVAWEADWQPRTGDPLVIGRKGTLYFLVASWDMTQLESFVAGTLTE